MSELSFEEARGVAESPKDSIALALVLLDRVAEALEDLANVAEGEV